MAWIAAGLAAALLVSLAALRTSSRRARELSSIAERLSQGDFSARSRAQPEGALGQLARTLNQLAERVHRAILELSREKTQLSTILSNMVEAVVAVDGEGRILVVNPALTKLFGVRSDEAAGRPLIEVLRHHRLNELLERTLKDGLSREDELSVVEPDERVFEAQAVPLALEGQRPGALLVLHDITRIRRLEQVRKDFVANVSHELRTPLASIKAFAETLRMGGIDDKENRLTFVETIENDADRMTRLIEDLLELSAIESGRRPPRLEAVPLEEALREAAQTLQPLADRRRVRLVAGPFPPLPPLRADRGQLRQVLTNLLDNAIKFNREGGTVTVSAVSRGPAVAVSISDTGNGIPSTDLPRLFERFYRVDRARSRELGGTGLGLSIVKHILEAHGGLISVESKVGEGSVFRFVLPAA